MSIEVLRFLYDLVGSLTFTVEAKEKFLQATQARADLLKMIEEHYANTKDPSI